MYKITPSHIEKLTANEVFVFGSHPNGDHSHGASRFALEHFGATQGQAEGLSGQSYAIPSVDLSLNELERHIKIFLSFAKDHSDLTFLVLPIGCGEAGFTPEQVAPFFLAAMQLDNVKLPEKFLEILGHKKREFTPDNISDLGPFDVFVFGSNTMGHHGGGAAMLAWRKFGAVWGQGEGLQGKSYGIPTMDGSVAAIVPYVDRFINFAKTHPQLKFYVTRIGCGIAGYKDEDIAPLFRGALEVPNIVLPLTFFKILSAS